jgi:hypothetical protein
MIRSSKRVLFVAGLSAALFACGGSDKTGAGGGDTSSTGTNGSGGGGGSGGAGTSFTLAEFDPIANVGEAFTNAAKVATATDLALLRVQGTPVGTASDFASVHFTWAFAFSAKVKGAASVITTTYPGWKSTTEEGLGIGATLSEKDVPKTIKIDGEKLLDALATAKVTESTCPLKGKGALQVRGNLEPMGTIWFWDLFCGTTQKVDIDAGTGKKLSP